nr:hypothetical protein Iba_chr14aCG24780 [Ipomoea batatas]GMD90784.1 hypothetical protein Iba_chr14dCG13020 [Ipomoea batatas]GME00789.1 hypothetical protein Iba_scaffold1675717CG0010 [Ipomoea batatas]
MHDERKGIHMTKVKEPKAYLMLMKAVSIDEVLRLFLLPVLTLGETLGVGDFGISHGTIVRLDEEFGDFSGVGSSSISS